MFKISNNTPDLQQQEIVKFVSNYEENNIELHVNFLLTDSIKQGTEIMICALFYIVSFVLNTQCGENQR